MAFSQQSLTNDGNVANVSIYKISQSEIIAEQNNMYKENESKKNFWLKVAVYKEKYCFGNGLELLLGSLFMVVCQDSRA